MCDVVSRADLLDLVVVTRQTPAKVYYCCLTDTFKALRGLKLVGLALPTIPLLGTRYIN